MMAGLIAIVLVSSQGFDRHRRRFDEVLVNMNIRGVSGRLPEPYEPTHDRYKAAVEVALDKVTGAVVVDNERIAVEYISYLKEQQAGVATFIPLVDVKPWPVDERLRRISVTAPLVICLVNLTKNITLLSSMLLQAVLYAILLTKRAGSWARTEVLLERTEKLSLEKRLSGSRLWTVVSDS
jgi:chromosome segregation ATPase